MLRYYHETAYIIQQVCTARARSKGARNGEAGQESSHVGATRPLQSASAKCCAGTVLDVKPDKAVWTGTLIHRDAVRVCVLKRHSARKRRAATPASQPTRTKPPGRACDR